MKLKEWLVYLLIFLLPTQLGKHFFLPFSYISGVRIDYLAPTIYLTDILIILLAILSIKKHKIHISSKFVIAFILIICNIAFSLSPWVSAYKWIKVIEVLVLFYILQLKLKPKYILISLVSSAVIQLVLSLYQISQQQSLQGIAYLFGERYFTISTPGIAKTVLQGVEILRAYGTFSHPNSLGGFFVLLYSFVLFEKRFGKELVLKYAFVGLSSILIFLSFSKVAIGVFLLVTIFYVIKNISCKFCAVGRIIGLLILSLVFISAQGDPESIQKRFYLIENALMTIKQFPLFGTGLGSYLMAQAQFPIPYSYLFFQPVHNIFLLLLAEVGIVLFGVISYFLFIFVKPFLKTQSGLILIFVVFFTGFFDHYWLTLQQNFILIPVVFGLLKNQKWK